MNLHNINFYSSNSDDETRAELTRLLFRASGKLAIMVNLVLALLLALTLHKHVDSSLLLAWLVFLFLVQLVRFFLLKDYRRHTSSADLARMLRYFRFSMLVTGLVWGFVPLGLYPHDSPPAQMVLLLMVVGVTAGATLAYSIDILSSITFLFSTTLPLVLRFVLNGTELDLAMAAMVLLYIYFVFVNISHIGSAMQENVRLRIEALHAETREQGRKRVLELLVQGAPLHDVLDTLLQACELENPAVTCSIWWLDEKNGHLKCVSAPGLPGYFIEAIENLPVDNADESLVNTAITGKRLYIEDIQMHPGWHACAAETGRAGLRCCWVEPILDAVNHVLGILVSFRREVGLPEATDLWQSEAASRLAAIAISRKRQEDALSESERKFRLMFESAEDCKLLLSMDGRIVDINESGHERLGYTKEEMLGRRIGEFDSQEFAELVPRRIAEIMSAGYGIFESEHVRKDGGVMPIEVSARLITLDGRQMVYSVIRDIGERKRMEQGLRDREAYYRAITETSAEGFWATDMTGKLLEVNDAYVHMSGYSREELLRMHIPELEAQERPEETRAHIEKIIREGSDRFESAHRTREGRVYPVEIVTSFWPLEGGRFFVFVTDISERKRHEEELRLAELVFLNSIESVSVTDAGNRIIAVNPAFVEMTGYSKEEVLGKDPNILKSGLQEEEFYRKMWHSLNTTGKWQGEIWDRRKDGSLFASWLSINTIYSEDGSVHRRVAMFSDITKRKQSEELIWRQANFDMLTQSPNRQMFLDRLEHEIKKADRTGDSVALCFIDLDRFKEVNDTLGHHMGDLLLQAASDRILSCVRDSDTVSRLGGDEFTVILPGLSGEPHVERVAKQIIDKLSAPFQLGNEVAHVTASIGITIYPGEARDADELVRHADQAMYSAKENGRNRYGFFTPQLQVAAQYRLRLFNDLNLAVSRNQFQVYYQPIIDLATDRISKAEALIRWVHPERGMIEPTEFISLAEDTGVINRIGNWVFREVVAWLKRCKDMNLPVMQVGVNKSPVQFRSEEGDFVESWLAYLESHGLSGNSIIFELTEGVLLHADSEVTRKLDQFHAAGMQIAIDDFGTGYSSLAYIKKFRIDYLKIDKMFIRHLETDENDEAMVEAIIVMAHKLGIKTVAEGVETQGQLDILRANGCDYAQGYLFSRPVPSEEFEDMLRSGQMLERNLLYD